MEIKRKGFFFFRKSMKAKLTSANWRLIFASLNQRNACEPFVFYEHHYILFFPFVIALPL